MFIYFGILLKSFRDLMGAKEERVTVQRKLKKRMIHAFSHFSLVFIHRHTSLY